MNKKIPDTAEAHYNYFLTTNPENCAKAVGWGSELVQEDNFKELCKIAVDLKHYKIIDVGCGLGALIEFLGINPEDYLGIDQIPEMIIRAKADYPEYSLICTNVPPIGVYEYAIMSGIFSLKGKKSPLAALKKTLNQYFHMVTYGIAFDVLSDTNPIKLPQLVYYDIDQLRGSLKRFVPSYFNLDLKLKSDKTTIFVYIRTKNAPMALI